MNPTDNNQQRQRSARGIYRIAPGLENLVHYDRSWFRGDFAAGVSVAAVALPVGVAYSEIAKVPPVIGIYSAIFPLFAYALFGSSRQLITGPDAATCLLVAASLAPLAGGDPQRYLALMVVLTLITGVFLVVAGILRLGFVASFLSQPILTGFLAGTALVIIAGQLKTLLGYPGGVRGFFPVLIEFARSIDQWHGPTLILGLSLFVVLVVIRRLLPRLPSALLVAILGIVLVTALDLDQKGITLLGRVPSGLPTLNLVFPTFKEFKAVLTDSAAIALLSFISGILTAKSFARRSRQELDDNQELIGFGACNIASGLAQGFPVTGASSRTAVNSAMGAKSQLAGIVAAVTMLLVLFFFTAPLTYVPNTALAAVIIVSSYGLVDYSALRELYATSHLEFGVAMVAMLGVLILGVLPGVGLAVGLSLAWLLYVESRPPDAVLGRVPGMKGYHSVRHNPEATTIPGVLIYQFRANLVFFNADHFKRRVRRVVAASDTPVEWVVLDAGPINYVDVTGIHAFDELSEELAARDIKIVIANLRRHLARYYGPVWRRKREERLSGYAFFTIKSAVKAFHESKRQPSAPEPRPSDS